MVNGRGLFLRDRFRRKLFCNRQSENAGRCEITRCLRSRPALGVKRGDAFSYTFANLRRMLGPQALLLAHQPHRGPIVLQTFARTKLIEAAALAAPSFC